MSVRRLLLPAGLLVTGAVLLLAFQRGPTAVGQFQPFQPPPRPKVPANTLPSNVVKQGFPAASYDPANPEASESAWEVEWELTHPENRTWYPPGSVPRIKSAKFLCKDKAGKPRWTTVVRMLEIAEIYVPYDNGNTAFLDVHDMSFNVTPARKECASGTMENCQVGPESPRTG